MTTVTDEEMVKLAQALVRIPSVSGEEQEVAKCLADLSSPSSTTSAWADTRT